MRPGTELPDLIVIDGGKGHLAVALSVIKDLGIDGVDVISLAKARNENDKLAASPAGRFAVLHKGQDRVYLPQKKDPVYLSRWPAVLFMLQRNQGRGPSLRNYLPPAGKREGRPGFGHGRHAGNRQAEENVFAQTFRKYPEDPGGFRGRASGSSRHRPQACRDDPRLLPSPVRRGLPGVMRNRTSGKAAPFKAGLRAKYLTV